MSLFKCDCEIKNNKLNLMKNEIMHVTHHAIVDNTKLSAVLMLNRFSSNFPFLSNLTTSYCSWLNKCTERPFVSACGFVMWFLTERIKLSPMSAVTSQETVFCRHVSENVI